MAFPFLTLLSLLSFCLACVALSQAAVHDGKKHVRDDVSSPDDDNDDDGFGIGRELTSLQKELRMGKRRFGELWRELKLSQSAAAAAAADDDGGGGGGGQGLEQPAFNQSFLAFRNETLRLHANLSSHLRSLNSFVTCLNSCARAHTDHMGTMLEGSIRYFCNKSCLMALEQHHLYVTSTGHQQSTTPDPEHVALIG